MRGSTRFLRAAQRYRMGKGAGRLSLVGTPDGFAKQLYIGRPQFSSPKIKCHRLLYEQMTPVAQCVWDYLNIPRSQEMSRNKGHGEMGLPHFHSVLRHYGLPIALTAEWYPHAEAVSTRKFIIVVSVVLFGHTSLNSQMTYRQLALLLISKGKICRTNALVRHLSYWMS